MSNPRKSAIADPIPGPSSVNRPVTSKARGICAYYKSKYGCYQGDRCKFLHGDEERLTPHDKSKPCRFYAAGYCRYDDKCWFIHANPSKPSSSSPESTTDTEDDEHLCSICYDKPTVYGLLIGCSHVFCRQCIKNWRGSQGKSADIIEAGTTKTCPMCRTTSRFVTPSSLFFPEGDPRKAEAIEKYKQSMARIKCRYFEKSRPQKRVCFFGNDCFYRHENADGTPYVFAGGADFYMERQRSRRNENDFMWEYLGQSSPGQMLDDIRLIAHMSTYDMQRAVLSSLAAVFGTDRLPSMYQLDEEPAHEAAVAPVANESEMEEPSDQVTVNSLSGGVVSDDSLEGSQAFFAEPRAASLSPVSTAASTLDPDSPVFVPLHLDNLRPLPSGPESNAAHLELPFQGLEEQQRAIEEHIPSNLEASSYSGPLDTPRSLSINEAMVHDAEPPFMTDGRGRVVWSRRSSSLSRVRATSPATILPHSKSTNALPTQQEGSNGPLQQTGSGNQLSTASRQLVRRRSVPLLGSSADAEFATDGRGRAVFASNNR